MSVSAAPRSERQVCLECGNERWISRRHFLAIQAGEHLNLCRQCRYRSQVRVTNRYRNWWLDRYTLDEILEMAAGLELILPDHSRGARQRRVA